MNGAKGNVCYWWLQQDIVPSVGPNNSRRFRHIYFLICEQIVCLNHHLLLIRLPSALCSAAQRQNIPSLLSGPAKGNSANLIFAHYVRSALCKEEGKILSLLGRESRRRFNPPFTHRHTHSLSSFVCSSMRQETKIRLKLHQHAPLSFFSLLPLPAIFFELYAFRFVSDTAQYKHVKYQGLQRRASEHDQKGRT